MKLFPLRASVHEIENAKRSLDLQIHRIVRRGARVTPMELLRVTELKKLRLVLKDHLYLVTRTA